MTSALKALLCSCLISCAAFASSEPSSSSSSEELIFSAQKIRRTADKSVVPSEWTQANHDLLHWAKSIPLSSKPHYRQAQEFYIQKIHEEVADLARILEQKKWEFFLLGVDKVSTLESSLRVLVSDETLDTADLNDEDVREVKRVVSFSSEEKVHINRAIPPEKDRCFEAIVIKRTRQGNSDTMIDMGTSELDSPALVSFTSLPKFKHEETTEKSIGFTVSREPALDVKYGVNSKFVINVDAFKSVYQVTANSFYRGADFRLKYNKSDGFLFLTDLTLVGEDTSLKSVFQGTKTKADHALLTGISEDESARLPGKIDLIFEFDLGGRKDLAFQMRLKEKKTKLFAFKGKDTNEWIVNFVRSKDLKVVMHLMNTVLCKDS
jgi:hypothetical protein